jgi:hypothetical protein
MAAIRDFIATVFEGALVLAGGLIALAVGAVLLVLLSLLAARPARPTDAAGPDPRRENGALGHIEIPGHSTEPMAVPRTSRPRRRWRRTAEG